MSRRVLIAEDSRTQREVLRAHLEQAGYHVSAAADGRQALNHLAANDVDLLISDVVMPEVDGYQLCRQAKQGDPRLPIILLTSMTDPMDVVRGLQAGADNFLRKPYDVPQLLMRVQKMLHGRQQRDAAQSQTELELFFNDERFVINAERQQILDLLVSTFEDLVLTNDQLRTREVELASARDALSEQLEEAKAQRQRLDAVLHAVPDAMLVVDADNRITSASQSFATLLGAPDAQSLQGATASDLLRLLRHNGEVVAPEDGPIMRALQEATPVQLGSAFDLLVKLPNGDEVPVLIAAAPVMDGTSRPVGAVGLVHELEALSQHDPLTHLPTHLALAQQVNSSVARSARRGKIAAVMVVVLDRSQEIRDSLGKARTDRLVISLAARLREALELPAVRLHTPAPSPAYLGDGEFAVVLPGLADEALGVLVADVVRKHIGGTHQVDDIEIEVTSTVGLSATAEAGAGAEDLVPMAAAAARAGSRRGGDHVASSDPGAAERAADRLRAEADLRRGIDRGELRVHYQPIVSLKGGVVGVEALVRWRHPELGLRPPCDFIPLAEETGLVVPLGWEVMRQSCRQMAAWRRDLVGGQDLVISVNLSSRQLVLPDVATRIQALLAETGLAPQALSLEITESGVVADAGTAADQLHRLRAMGVGISVDDFGTGYSSLLQLRKLPVDILKVDREFVSGLPSDPDDAVIVSASVSLALALRLKVVAEGVETVEQAQELHRLGCDFGQGYLWSRPLEATDFEQLWMAGTVRDQVTRELGTGRSQPLLEELSAPSLDLRRTDSGLAHRAGGNTAEEFPHS